MARKLPEIPKCKSCGRPVIGGVGGLCKACQLKRASEDYQKVVRAEQDMEGGDSWKMGYSAWRSVFIIVVAILALLLMAVVLVIASGA